MKYNEGAFLGTGVGALARFGAGFEAEAETGAWPPVGLWLGLEAERGLRLGFEAGLGSGPGLGLWWEEPTILIFLTDTPSIVLGQPTRCTTT